MDIKGRNIKDEPPLAAVRVGFFYPPLEPLNGKGGAKQVKATNAEKEKTVPKKRNFGNTSKQIWQTKFGRQPQKTRTSDATASHPRG